MNNDDTPLTTATLEARDPHEVMDDYLPGEHREPDAESRHNHASFVAMAPASRYVDKEEADPEEEVNSYKALLAVVFDLGTWAKDDPVRQYAARVVMRMEAQSAKNFARENKVSESLVFLRLNEAKKRVGLEREKADK